MKVCPRCGRETMREPDVLNALSRYEDYYICSDCGTEEAIHGLMGKTLPFEEWAMNKESEEK